MRIVRKMAESEESLDIDNPLFLSYLEQNILELEARHKIKLRVDTSRKKVFVSGNNLEFRTILWFRSQYCIKKIFFVGSNPSTTVDLALSTSCINKGKDQHCLITKVENLNCSAVKSLKDVPYLKLSLEEALETASQKLRNNVNSVCSTWIQLGVMHYNHCPGKRFSPNKNLLKCHVYEDADEQLLNLNKLKLLPTKGSSVRYDIKIYPKDISACLKYRIYVNEMKAFFLPVNEIDSEYNIQYNQINIGPGILSMINPPLAKLDVVELRKNLSIRISLYITSYGEKEQEILKNHSENLAPFLSGIKLKTTDDNNCNLIIPDVPEQYDLTYQRRCLMTEYQYDINKSVRISSGNKIYISFINERLTDELASPAESWNRGEILRQFEETLVLASNTVEVKKH